MGLPRKGQLPVTAVPAGDYLVTDERWRKKLPLLFEFIARNRWEAEAGSEGKGGEARETGTMTVFAEDGALKLCLSDRETGSVAFVAAGDLEGLLAAAEKGFQGDSLDWRLSRSKSRSAARRGG